jgi:hypothetical protein
MWLIIEDQGFIMINRILTVGRADSAAMEHLLKELPVSKIIGLTGGQKRRTVVVLDSGHVVLTALSVQQIVKLLERAG